MTKLFEKVNPGDLISSKFMNQVLDEIQSLEDRVSLLTALGAGGGPPVLNPLPPGPWHVGDDITLSGQNFGPLATTVVTIGNATINQFESGSSDSILRFTIPTIFAADQGTPLLLTVSTPKGSATTSITIFPVQPTMPSGSLLSSLVQSPPGTLAANQSFIFVFSIVANLNMPETFSVSPSVDVGWLAVYVDGSGNPVLPSEVSISGSSSSQPVTVSIPVKVTIPANPGPSGQLQLTITSKRNPMQLTKTSAPFTLTIGGSGPVVSPNIKPSIGFQGPKVNYDGTKVLIAAGAMVAVPFSVFFAFKGIYTIKLLPIKNDPTNLWTVKLITPSTINVGQDNSNFTGSVVTVAAQAAAPTTQFVFRVESQADSTVATELPQPIKLKP